MRPTSLAPAQPVPVHASGGPREQRRTLVLAAASTLVMLICFVTPLAGAIAVAALRPTGARS